MDLFRICSQEYLDSGTTSNMILKLISERCYMGRKSKHELSLPLNDSMTKTTHPS